MVEMSPKKYQASVGDFRAAFDVENMFTQASGGGSGFIGIGR